MIKIYNIILSHLEENQKHFWLNDRLKHIEKKNFFTIIYPATSSFRHRSSHKEQEPEILNTLRLVYF